MLFLGFLYVRKKQHEGHQDSAVTLLCNPEQPKHAGLIDKGVLTIEYAKSKHPQPHYSMAIPYSFRMS